MPSAAVAPINSFARLDISRIAIPVQSTCNCTSTLETFVTSDAAMSVPFDELIARRWQHRQTIPSGSTTRLVRSPVNTGFSSGRNSGSTVVSDSSSVSKTSETYFSNRDARRQSKCTCAEDCFLSYENVKELLRCEHWGGTILLSDWDCGSIYGGEYFDCLKSIAEVDS